MIRQMEFSEKKTNMAINRYKTNGGCRHEWLPMCSYRLSDGSRWTRYNCAKCGEIIERQMTAAENNQNSSKEIEVNDNGS